MRVYVCHIETNVCKREVKNYSHFTDIHINRVCGVNNCVSNTYTAILRERHARRINARKSCVSSFLARAIISRWFINDANDFRVIIYYVSIRVKSRSSRRSRIFAHSLEAYHGFALTVNDCLNVTRLRYIYVSRVFTRCNCDRRYGIYRPCRRISVNYDTARSPWCTTQYVNHAATRFASSTFNDDAI